MMDCAIVCGYPANEDGTISNILESRIRKAIELYHKKEIRYIPVYAIFCLNDKKI